MTEQRHFPLKDDKLELEWTCKIKKVVVSCLRNEGILDCIRTVHLCRYGTTKADSKVVVRITRFKPFPVREKNPELSVPHASYEDVLQDVFGSFGLQWEIENVEEQPADHWGANWEGKWRDFLDPNDPMAPA